MSDAIRLDWDGYEEGMYGTRHMQIYLQIRNEVIVSLLESTFPGVGPVRILDVGQGTGLTYAEVANASSRYRLFGADLSQRMICQAARRVGGTQCAHLARANALQLPYRDHAFDMVYTTRFIHQFRDKRQILDELRRVTKPGGLIAIEFYARPCHWVEYWLQGIRQPKADFFYHFPTRAEVRTLIPGPALKIPLRPAGARLIFSLLRERALKKLTQLTKMFPFSALLDEYFLVFRNQLVAEAATATEALVTRTTTPLPPASASA